LLAGRAANKGKTAKQSAAVFPQRFMSDADRGQVTSLQRKASAADQ